MKGETVRTLIVVTIVAVLVWLFAESRTLRSQSFTIPVEIGAGGSGMVFRLSDPDEWAGSVEVEVVGPAALIDALRSRSNAGMTLELGAELPSEPGVRSIEMLDAVRRDEMFADSGLTVRRVVPRVLSLQSDRVETLSIVPEADLGGLETAGPITIEPAEIGVRLPASIASRVTLGAVARIPPNRLTTLAAGRRSQINQVPVELTGLPDDAWGHRLLDPRAVVTLALRARTRTLQMPEIQIRLSMTPTDLAAWSVRVPPEDRVLQGVTLTGPVSAIDQIERGGIVPGAVASIDLGGIDEEVSDTSRTVSVRLTGLPAGVVADLQDREIRVMARRRAVIEGAAEPAGGAAGADSSDAGAEAGQSEPAPDGTPSGDGG